jgi:hypothetical protein
VVKDAFGNMSRDALLKDELMDKIDRVVLTLDANNKIHDGKEENMQYYSVVLTPQKDLQVTVNLKSADQYLYNFEQKMDKVLNMRFAQSKRDWEKTKRKEQMAQVSCSLVLSF